MGKSLLSSSKKPVTTEFGFSLDPYLSETLGPSTPLKTGIANEAHEAKVRAAADKVDLVVRLSEETPKKIMDEAFALYLESFPSDDEREPTELIVERIARNPAAFHAHAYLDKNGTVVGYCQGSIVRTVEGEQGSNTAHVFFFLQYCCVSPLARGGGALQLMHAVNTATLIACGKLMDCEPLGSLWETEPAGLGDDDEARAFTKSRLVIHNKVRCCNSFFCFMIYYYDFHVMCQLDYAKYI